jgi:hypothetical protein
MISVGYCPFYQGIGYFKSLVLACQTHTTLDSSPSLLGSS